MAVSWPLTLREASIDLSWLRQKASPFVGWLLIVAGVRQGALIGALASLVPRCHAWRVIRSLCLGGMLGAAFVPVVDVSLPWSLVVGVRSLKYVLTSSPGRVE